MMPKFCGQESRVKEFLDGQESPRIVAQCSKLILRVSLYNQKTDDSASAHQTLHQQSVTYIR